jgi:hypothetical protein
MPKRLVVSTVALIAGLTFSPILRVSNRFAQGGRK